MSTLREITAEFAWLVLLVACAPSAYSAAEAPATAPLTTPSTPAPTVSASAPAAARPTSAAQSFARLDSLMAVNPRLAVPVLVIPAIEMPPETYDRIVEDLTIMNRILEKSVAEAPDLYPYDGLRREVATLQMLQHTGYLSPWGGKWIPRSSNGQPKPMFVGGYGAVFSLAVDFPLLPPPATPEPNQASERTDPTWAQAQRELQDPQAALGLQRATPQGRVYRAEAVESLRSTLIGSLKHATNIRDLGSQDWLTLLVQGPAPTPQDGAPEAGAASGSGSPYGRQQQARVLPGTRSEGRTLLTLRVRKADIDQYAKGQLDDTQFHQRVQIVTH